MDSQEAAKTSPRQRELLEAFLFLTRGQGFAPSVREVAAHVGVSKTRAYQLAQVCIARGYLEQNTGTPRSWRLSRAGMEALLYEQV
jgi:hypothetical protein